MSTVDFTIFVERMGEVLEVSADYLLVAKLADVKEYDSMGRLAVSLLIEELFGFQIDFDILDSHEDLRSLYDYCFSKG
jgi:hypothetical protein